MQSHPESCYRTLSISHRSERMPSDGTQSKRAPAGASPAGLQRDREQDAAASGEAAAVQVPRQRRSRCSREGDQPQQGQAP